MFFRGSFLVFPVPSAHRKMWQKTIVAFRKAEENSAIYMIYNNLHANISSNRWWKLKGIFFEMFTPKPLGFI